MSSLIQDNRPEAVLALADGTLFRGRSIGAPSRTIAEVVFNTSMTGYQEILTDPSYTGQIVNLTFKEFELLCYLIENKGMVLTRDQLLSKIWGYDFDGETRTVDVHIRTLRQKLGEASRCIETIRGVGYKLEESET